MPTYIFKDMSTGEEFQDFMSINEKETYLQTNTNIVQLPNTINFVGDHIMGVGPKNDGGFNERMSQIGCTVSTQAGKSIRPCIRERGCLGVSSLTLINRIYHGCKKEQRN